MRSPRFYRDCATSISPRQIAGDGSLHFFMRPVVRIVECEFFERGKLTFNSVQPRGIGGNPVELEVVGFSPFQNILGDMRSIIVQDQVQGFGARKSTPKELQKGQPLLGCLACRELTKETSTFEIVGGKKMLNATETVIGRSVTFDRFGPFLCEAVSVSGQDVERTEFVHADSSAACRSAMVKSPYSAVFLPKLRIGGCFPALGTTPSNAVTR